MRFWWSRGCEMHPEGRRDSLRGKIPKADDRRVAPSLWFCRWFCEVVARLQPECQHHVHLVADLLGEVMQGPPQDGIGAVVEQLERWDMFVPLDEDCEYVGQGVRQQSAGATGRRWCCVWCPGTMSGEPNTA